ncbi:hypothetical protein L2E82_14244 [Cichorium intybus]|uniref:Uncharacterized protein n=1 Tax=Cichorium intybus TaxID=13427 RepID=A0ACB9EZE7_CICIN|nr:hypothetical protein L2E82_14244 [Cichorium intybus]
MRKSGVHFWFGVLMWWQTLLLKNRRGVAEGAEAVLRLGFTDKEEGGRKGWQQWRRRETYIAAAHSRWRTGGEDDIEKVACDKEKERGREEKATTNTCKLEP